MALEAGLRVGKYELGRKLGHGGFGSVFVARDTSLDREVALKFMHAEHTARPDILKRFLQEARSAAKISHPGIVTVFECGQVQGTGTPNDGITFIAMELLHGETLSARLARAGRQPPPTAVEIVHQLASALAAAHDAGIVHRDLKPDNIFLVVDPAMHSGERVKILDFGIAKLAQPAEAHADARVQTHSMMVFGTPRYMSPEQCRSAAGIDHRSDIYTLGCILFELVTGKTPFDGEFGELIAMHQLAPPRSARSLVPSLPADLDGLIARMLAKQPELRPQTMQAVQRELEGLSAGLASMIAVVARSTPSHGSPRISDVGQTPQAGGPGSAAVEPTPATEAKPPAAAAAVATTLGAAAGPTVAPATQRANLAWPAIALVAVAAALAFVGVRRTRSEPAAAPVPVTVAPASSPAPVLPADIALTIRSPQNAEIYSIDRLLLGRAPHTIRRPPGEGKVVLFVRAEGFVEQRVELPADRSSELDVVLVAKPARRPSSRSAEKATAAEVGKAAAPPPAAPPREPDTRASAGTTQEPPTTEPDVQIKSVRRSRVAPASKVQYGTGPPPGL